MGQGWQLRQGLERRDYEGTQVQSEETTPGEWMKQSSGILGWGGGVERPDMTWGHRDEEEQLWEAHTMQKWAAARGMDGTGQQCG